MKTKVAGVIEPAKSTNCKEYPSVAGRLNGKVARMSVGVATGRFTKWAIIGKIKRNLGFEDLLSFKIEDEPLTKINEIYATEKSHPSVDPLVKMKELEQLINEKENVKPYKTLNDYYEGYRSKSTTPTKVCSKLIELMGCKEIKNINGIIEVHKEEIIQAALESTERFKNNLPLSVIDGVPFVAKDHIDIAGYLIHWGSPPLMDRKCLVTSTVIKRLLNAGAILVGTASMVAAGLNVIGSNPSKLYGHARNPYNTAHYCGGSSSGSAAVVSCGLVPFAIGTDGFGSNRIPTAFTGTVGIRCTTYRVSNGSTDFETSNSIICAPITTNVQDNAIIYGIIAGPDDLNPLTLYQPSLILPKFKDAPSELASTIKIGYDSSYINFAHEKSIVSAVEATIQRLKDMGFTVVDYCVPEMNEIIVSTRVFFCKDAAMSLAKIIGKGAATAKFTCAAATLLNSLGYDITEKEYDQALRQRKRTQLIVKDMFSKFDVFVTPTTGVVAQKIIDDDDVCGVLDDVITQRIMTYVSLASASGIPALSVHVDTTSDENLPIGIQLEASWWREDILYELGHLIESFLPAEKRSPKVIVSPL